jgi:hypothetical protein
MPRSRSSSRRSAYWWSEEIAELWRFSTSARRLLSRAKKQRGDQTGIDAAYEAYRAAQHLMRQAIRKAKAKSWEELLNSLDADSWGHPYKLVLGKLRSEAPSVAGSLAPNLLSEVVNTLFPVRGRCMPSRSTGPIPWRGHGRGNVRGL